MRFAHLADAHIGAWRDERLRELSIAAFETAVEGIIRDKADFVLISGDLFNTSLPALEPLRRAVASLQRLKRERIPVYLIAGSHDFSPSGKTMLDVLEEVDLFTNVARFERKGELIRPRWTVDPRTGAMVCGMIGRKKTLERSYYGLLDLDGLVDEGKEGAYRIFMFHSAIQELKPEGYEQMDAIPLSMLPKGFDYYAGGHVHEVIERDEPGYGAIVFPGPLFPNSFKEIEHLRHGGYFLVEDGRRTYRPLVLKPHLGIALDCSRKTPAQVTDVLMGRAREEEKVRDAVVTIRLSGTLAEGRIADIGYRAVSDALYHAGAYAVMRNASKLHAREFEEIRVGARSGEEMEARLIEEQAERLGLEHVSKGLADREAGMKRRFVRESMRALSLEQNEGETKDDYRERVRKAARELFGV
ncbi:exonuclease SbcCD subunit D [Candidatus Woesearchaeota archaeon]|nr:exonuclease SbcCD subunit D [Candidatus Woesearchaeota archaeon]